MFVAVFEEMQSKETTISSDGDWVSDLVREGNIWIAFKWLRYRNKFKYISLFDCVRDVFDVIAPTINDENVKY